MSDPEELYEDETKNRSLEDAIRAGDALPCDECGLMFFLSELYDVQDRLICIDCRDEVI